MASNSDLRRRPRVLLLAYACSPVRGGESAVGWNRALESARRFDTWVICEEHEFAADIRQYVAREGEVPGLRFVFVPMPRWQWAIGHRQHLLWYHVLRRWHRRVYREAQRLHAAVGFDLVHQLTFCGFREPSDLWKLGVPFVWGPVGGTQGFPWRFLGDAGVSGMAREAWRNLLNAIQLRFSLRVRRAARTAAVILTATSTGERDFARVLGSATEVLSDVGVSCVGAVRREPGDDGQPLRILWSGVLGPHKALWLLIEALARLPEDTPYQLRILGEGSCRRRWERLAQERGVAEHIEWPGWLPHQEALAQFAWADLFVFTSLRDTTGTVLPEALAAGLPVVCLDHQGAHDVVTDACGVRIPVTRPREVIVALRDAIVGLAHDRTRREQMGRAALERAREFLWTRQGEHMAAVYRRVLSTSAWRMFGVPATPGLLLPQPARADQPAMAPARSSRPDGRLRRGLRGCFDRCTAQAAVGAHALAGNRLRAAFGILMYHRVAEETPGVPPPTWNVTPQRLREQWAGLLARGYQAWPLRRALECHRQGVAVPRNVFVVAFDDGYENVYTVVRPICRELQIPVTVFVCTAYLDRDVPLPFEDWPGAGSERVPASSWRMLSRAQCAELLADGLFELGTHTHRHEDFRGRPEALHRDLLDSLAMLREQFGLEQVSFAFPFGFTAPELIEAARAAGVTCSLTAARELVTPRVDPFHWGRFAAESCDTSTTLAAKLSGWYGVFRDGWKRWPLWPRAAHDQPQSNP